MVALSEQTMTKIRQRRAAGERLAVLAAEIGMPWQRLDKALRHGTPAVTRQNGNRSAEGPIILTPAGAGPLTERYRPRSLAAVLGQDRVVRFLLKLTTDPHPIALLFEGETGTGKTSAALALAAELGCAVEHQELGGLHVIASGEQTADAVRGCYSVLANRPFYGSGWKVLVVNEADRMHPQAETVWLDRLENLPPKTVIVFTTNHADRLSQRFRDRCVRLTFVSDQAKVRPAARSMLVEIWKRETGRAPRARLVDELLDRSVENGQLSFRRAVACLQERLMEGGVQ